MALDLQKPEDEEVEDAVEREDDDSGQPSGDDQQEEGGADETDELDEEEVAEEVDAQPEPKPSRAEARFQKLANEAKEARERAERVEREFNEFKSRTPAQPVQQEREPTADEMALWSPDQIVDYKLGKATRNYDAQLRQIQFQTWESSDKAAWSTKCSTDPRAKKFEAEVETELSRLRASGQNIERVKLYKYMLGDKIDQGIASAKAKAQATGAKRVQRAQGRPSNPSGDQQVQRGKLSDKEARNKRLENAVF